MRIKTALFLILAVLPLLVYVQIGEAASYEGLTIKDIKLKNNVNTDSTLIMAQISSRVGQKYAAKTVSRDIHDLFFLGYFDNIKVDAQKVAGGVELTYIFSEYAKIGKVVIRGNDELSESDIRDTMVTLKPGTVYNKVILQKNIDNVIKKYKQEGFINAEIKHKVTVDEETKKAVIVLDIDEGEEIVIETITIKGAKQLDADSVKDELEDTHESSLFRSGIYDEFKFDKDKERIVKYYHDRGFIRMQITNVDFDIREIEPDDPEEDEKGIFLTIYIDEGKRYKLGKLAFEGNEVFSEAKIEKDLFDLKEGEFFNKSQYQKDTQSLWQAYADRGYIFAHIVPKRDINEEKQIIDVSYTIFESDKAHIENIYIKGNSSTKKYVIERELRIKEGEVYNRQRIQRSQERLYNLRFFKDVSIQQKPGSVEGLMDLTFSVKEDRTGLFTLGAGYGTVSGFSFYEQVSENNFLGRGIRIHERAEWGETRKGVSLGIDTPYLFTYNPTSLGLSLSYNVSTLVNVDTNYMDMDASEPMLAASDDDEYAFKRKTFEIQLRGGRTISEYWRFYSSYTFAWIDSYDPNFALYEGTNQDAATMESIEDLREALEGGFTTKSSLRTGAIYDSRDFVGGPSRGIYFSQYLTYTGGILGGNSDYIMSDSNFSFYIPLLWNFVFAQDLKLEMIFNQLGGGFNIYPGDEAGFDGMTELRGWRDYNKDGRGKIATLTEIRYPINRQVIWGVLFYDTGKIWDHYSDISLNFKEYKHSFGFGFRLQLSVLPIRLYFAKRFDYEDGKFHWIGDAGEGFFKGWETIFSVAGVF